MSENIRDYEFRSSPKVITYSDDDPLKLNKDFCFFHNKNKFRKELTKLQLIPKEYVNFTLLASGIRDSYLKEEYSENFLIVIFTTNQIIRDANQIITPYVNTNIKSGCFLLESTSNYMLLLAKDMDGLKLGVESLEDILVQTFKLYFEQSNSGDYIKIKPFKLLNCLG